MWLDDIDFKDKKVVVIGFGVMVVILIFSIVDDCVYVIML